MSNFLSGSVFLVVQCAAEWRASVLFASHRQDTAVPCNSGNTIETILEDLLYISNLSHATQKAAVMRSL